MPTILDSFTAIDFETAQGPRWSICQVGLVRVEKKKIVQQLELLVKPPDNFYAPINIQIHGITPQHTKNSPTFKLVWPQIKNYIDGQNIVAHNMAFDRSCLKQTLRYYSLKIPQFNHHCTYKLYGARLDVLCNQFAIKFNHHNALSDAIACSKLFMRYHKITIE
jgi:DNA polymerase III subunit epsilon